MTASNTFSKKEKKLKYFSWEIAPSDTSFGRSGVSSEILIAGFYRVNYDVENWMALTGQLMDSVGAIHVLNRAQLIDDAFHLAMAGRLSYLVPLRLSEYLVNERSVTPWRPAMKGLRYLFDQMPRRADGYAALKVLAAATVHRITGNR